VAETAAASIDALVVEWREDLRWVTREVAELVHAREVHRAVIDLLAALPRPDPVALGDEVIRWAEQTRAGVWRLDSTAPRPSLRLLWRSVQSQCEVIEQRRLMAEGVTADDAVRLVWDGEHLAREAISRDVNRLSRRMGALRKSVDAVAQGDRTLPALRVMAEAASGALDHVVDMTERAWLVIAATPLPPVALAIGDVYVDALERVELLHAGGDISPGTDLGGT
jgi:hypothetical protein